MLSIESFRGRTEIRCVLATAVVLLLTVSAVLVYDYSRAAGGGEDDTESAREVVSYGDDKFIDKEGYDGGDAKLIYNIASYENKTVYIADMERGLRSSSYTTFPTEVKYGGDTYTVVGALIGTTYQDTAGVVYKLDTANKTASVEDFNGTGTSVCIPAAVTCTDDATTYTVNKINCSTFKTANITDITIVVPKVSEYKLNQSFQFNTTLKSVKFVVDSDDPNVTDSDNAGWVDIGGAFKGCTALTSLTLPNVLHRADFAFAGCTSLGSSADAPLIFNTFLRTKSETDCMFSGCTGLKYLEIGNNVNKISSIFGPSDDGSFTGCEDIKLIYNTSSLSESDIAASILESGSYNVLLYMLGGGEFTQGATVDGDASSGYTVTMPRGTYDGVNIPSWTHKDGTVWFDSGSEYTSFKPWGTTKTAYSYYYYALYGTCTVTYHVRYLDGSTEKTDIQTQTVPCMYNTPLYDENTYPNSDLGDRIRAVNFWFVADSEFGDASYNLGQAVTLHTDIDMVMFADGTSDKPQKTLTLKWDYINPETRDVTTYSDKVVTKEYSASMPELYTFKNYATDSSGTTIPESIQNLVGLRAIGPNGTSITFGSTVKFFCDLTLTVNSGSDEYQLIRYENESMSVQFRGFQRSTTVDHIVVAPNTFSKDSSTYKDDPYHFVCWNTSSDGTGTSYYPGDIIECKDTNTLRLFSIWAKNSETDSKVTVTYNNIYKDGSSTSDEQTYTYNNTEKLQTYTRSGYTLIGWSYTKDGAEKGNVNFQLDTPVRMGSNLRLYAVWEQNPPTVIVDNELKSVDEAGTWDHNPGYVFIGKLSDGDKVELTVTFYNKDNIDVEKPTAVGIYTMKVGYQIFDKDGSDVTKNYYSGYDGTPVTKNCYDGILTIYRGDHSAVAD